MTDYHMVGGAGSVRRRVRYLGIRTPLNAPPTVEILEQDVILLTDGGEAVLLDLGACPIGDFDVTESFPTRSLETDAMTGETATVGQVMELIYSWVRHKQTVRDAAEAT
jgi:hypothetical protein